MNGKETKKTLTVEDVKNKIIKALPAKQSLNCHPDLKEKRRIYNEAINECIARIKKAKI